MANSILPQIRGLFEAHLTVADLGRSVAFYRDTLGLPLALAVPDRHAAFFWVPAAGRGLLGLWAIHSSPIGPRLHVAFTVSLDELLRAPAALRAKGLTPLDFDGRPTSEPVVLSWMPAASLYFHDPDGHLLEYLCMLDGPPRPAMGASRIRRGWPEGRDRFDGCHAPRLCGHAHPSAANTFPTQAWGMAPIETGAPRCRRGPPTLVHLSDAPPTTYGTFAAQVERFRAVCPIPRVVHRPPSRRPLDPLGGDGRLPGRGGAHGRPPRRHGPTRMRNLYIAPPVRNCEPPRSARSAGRLVARLARLLTARRSPVPAARPCAVEALEGRALLSATDLLGPAPFAPAPPAAAVALARPYVTTTTPAANATGVLRDAFISCEVALPNGGIDPATLTPDTAYLYRRSDLKRIPVVVNTSGAGDVIVVRPLVLLDPGEKYGVAVSDGVKDVAGAAFKPFILNFTAGAGSSAGDPSVHFEKVSLPTTAGRQYLAITMGPDGRLYAGATDGNIYRFPVNPDGTLGDPTVIDSVARSVGGASLVVGLAFDPASTADNPILWVSHTAATWFNAPDWSGRISRLSGPDLSTCQPMVVDLPRSFRDHLTNQLAFGPDGALYFCQASNTAMGAADLAWGDRPERQLTAAVLRLDTSLLSPTAPLGAMTADGGGSYNPFAAGAPLTFYATGVRNAYDLLWHSNGSLYAPTNGSAAGGNAPGSPDGYVPALNAIPEPETDYLFRVQPGRYYGHPNPVRGEFVLNGGNPTAGADPFEVAQYPVGMQPQPNWEPAVFDMGAHQSPNGAIEYRGGAFGGTLDRQILVCRYSGGGDVVALRVGPDGTITGQTSGMAGMTGFVNPLDLAEDTRTGDVYVSEFGGRRITLLRVVGSTGAVGGSTGGGTTDPVPEPTPAPTPTPPPTPLPRSKADREMIVRIRKFAAAHRMAEPDLTAVPSAELRNVYAGLKDQYRWDAIVAKITALAAKKNYPLPSTDGLSLDQLVDLRKTVLKAKAAKPAA